MEELLKYIQSNHNDGGEHVNPIGELLEYLYFAYVRPPFRTLLWSEEYKIAQDLLQLDALNELRLDLPKIRTKFVGDLLSKYAIVSPLTPESRDTVKHNIVEKHRYYITAVFIADIVRSNNSRVVPE